MGTAQEQALRTKTFQQNQALFQRCTAVDRAIKYQIVKVFQQLFLSPIMDQLSVLGQVTALYIMQHLFRAYGDIDKIYVKENSVKMVGPYETVEPLAQLSDQLEKGWEFSIAVWHTVADTMMVSKGVTLLKQMATFNEDTR